MSRIEDLSALLNQAFAEAIPESRSWSPTITKRTWWIELPWPVTSDQRSVTIDLNNGDVDIGFVVGPSGVGRGPYELSTTIPDEDPATELKRLATFVGAFMSEEIVLVMARGWLRGGRDFVHVRDLTPERRMQLEWIASWHGTYDVDVPR